MFSFLAGQAFVLFQMPEPIDETTPKEAHDHMGFDENEYELVFLDEFDVDGRTFWHGGFFLFLFYGFFLFLAFFSFLFDNQHDHNRHILL